jgi:hypothetical protein
MPQVLFPAGGIFPPPFFVTIYWAIGVTLRYHSAIAQGKGAPDVEVRNFFDDGD